MKQGAFAFKGSAKGYNDMKKEGGRQIKEEYRNCGHFDPDFTLCETDNILFIERNAILGMYIHLIYSFIFH